MPITSKDLAGKAPKPEAKPEVEAEPVASVSKPSDSTTVYVANQSGVTTIDGASFQFRSGVTHVTGNDPAYRAHPELFSSVSDRARPVIEKATKAPGEKRGE